MNARINAFIVFKDVALDLYEKIDKNKPLDTFNEIIAFVVNGSLACEIGIKVILAENDYQERKSHDLKKLFDELDEITRNFIKENMPSLKPNEEGLEEFDSLLIEVSKNFVEWRYYYEKDIKTNWLFIYELICAFDRYFNGDNFLKYLEEKIKKHVVDSL